MKRHYTLDTYTIRQALWYSPDGEILIYGDRLLYTELSLGEKEFHWLQTNNKENKDKIKQKLMEISKLIKEIDELNKI